MKRLSVLFLSLVVFCACSDSIPTDAAPETLSFTIVGDPQREGYVGEQLIEPMVVLVEDVRGKKSTPVEGVVVNFVVTQGGGSVWAGAGITDSDGFAADYWTLGPEPGTNALEVRAVTGDGTQHTYGEFTATATWSPSVDADQDGIRDSGDNCPAVANPGQEDYEGDGVGDVCDSDDDDDGVLDSTDSCPFGDTGWTSNPNNDMDSDGCRDATEDLDDDGDDVPDITDNCPLIPNPSQTNQDGDQYGDPCDPALADTWEPNDSEGAPSNLGSLAEGQSVNAKPLTIHLDDDQDYFRVSFQENNTTDCVPLQEDEVYWVDIYYDPIPGEEVYPQLSIMDWGTAMAIQHLGGDFYHDIYKLTGSCSSTDSFHLLMMLESPGAQGEYSLYLSVTRID